MVFKNRLLWKTCDLKLAAKNWVLLQINIHPFPHQLILKDRAVLQFGCFIEFVYASFKESLQQST